MAPDQLASYEPAEQGLRCSRGDTTRYSGALVQLQYRTWHLPLNEANQADCGSLYFRQPTRIQKVLSERVQI